MYVILYKQITKRGHIRADILAYPDKSPMTFESYDDANEAGDKLVKDGLAVGYQVRRIY